MLYLDKRLLEVSGTAARPHDSGSYAEQAQQREIFRAGVTPRWPSKSEAIRRNAAGHHRNPYRLVEDVEGIGFKTADRIAASLGIEQDGEYRSARA
ncbi:MAG: helix-hairpin-helix domain-containing protein [Christensenellales bacterium]